MIRRETELVCTLAYASVYGAWAVPTSLSARHRKRLIGKTRYKASIGCRGGVDLVGTNH
jgi:hypothetical protein